MKLNKTLCIILLLLSIINFVNMSILYFFPKLFPFINYTIIRLVFISFIEKKYFLIGIALLLNTIMIFSIVSIKRKKIVFPVITTIIYIVDLIFVGYLFLYDLIVKQFLYEGYLPTIIINIVVIILMILYLHTNLVLNKKKKANC